MKKLLILGALILFSLPVFAAADFLDHKEVKLGQPAADFSLPDLQGKVVNLSDAKGKIVVLNFWSAQCPFVLRYEERVKALAGEYGAKGVAFYGIDSNATENPDQMRKVSGERQINYPILVDEGNKIADRFGAITTPHIFILDKSGNLAYEGAVDDQGWDEKSQPKTPYVKEALDALLAGQPVPNAQTKTVGCTVKRK